MIIHVQYWKSMLHEEVSTQHTEHQTPWHKYLTVHVRDDHLTEDKLVLVSWAMKDRG